MSDNEYDDLIGGGADDGIGQGKRTKLHDDEYDDEELSLDDPFLEDFNLGTSEDEDF